MEDKIRLQSKATEKYYETIFDGAEGVGREEGKGSIVTRTEKAHFDPISMWKG